MRPSLLLRPRALGRRGVQKLGHLLRYLRLGRIPELLAVERDEYDIWALHHDPKPYDRYEMQAVIAGLKRAPTFSICMPVCDPPLHFLREAVESVFAQVYPHWELCVVNDAGTDRAVSAYLREIAADPRVCLHDRTERGGIARATNDALSAATGDYVAFLDHDDVLAAHALYRFGVIAAADSTIGMMYSDEDKIDAESGRRYDPFFKPDWSPETLLSKMYVGHFLALRRDLVNAAGRMRPEYDGSQDYDLVLRVTELSLRIVHVPDVLYHWRAHATSAALRADEKPYANDAARRALQDALVRRGDQGVVFGTRGHVGRFTIRYARRSDDAVTIVIPTRDRPQVLSRALKSIFSRSTYRHFEVLVVDNGSREKTTERLLSYWRKREPERFRVLRDDRAFNYSALNNAAVRQTQNPYIVLLNNDTQVLSRDWLEAMLEYAQRPGIGAVGALLLYGDRRVQHAGVVLGIGGLAGHLLKRSRPTSRAYFDALTTVSNYSAVTGACLMIKRELYERVGGLDETLPVAWNDVDFCLRLNEAGLRNVYLPHVKLLHHESLSRGRKLTPEEYRRNALQVDMLRRKWHIARGSDPFYSPWLTLEREDATLAP
jgi:GT2 family glycosyltransferase